MQPSPFLKWAGSKRQLASHIANRIGPIGQDGTYIEPFLGAGAVFFALPGRPGRVHLGDTCQQLVRTWRGVASSVETTVNKLDELSDKHGRMDPKMLYLRVRELFNRGEYTDLGRFAAAFIYLNRVGFNGIWRVNREGKFNVPFGDRPRFDYDKENLMLCNRSLAHAQVHHCSYTEIERKVGDPIEGPNFTVYMDPPYDGTFDQYSSDRFDRSEQARLRWWFGVLAKSGVRVLLSNADTPFVRAMYADFDIEDVQVRRSVGASSETRKKVNELLITANL